MEGGEWSEEGGKQSGEADGSLGACNVRGLWDCSGGQEAVGPTGLESGLHIHIEES